MKTRFAILLLFLTAWVYASAQAPNAKELMNQFRYKEAVEWLNGQPESVENLLLKAESYEKLYDYPAAIAAYETVFAQDTTRLPIIISLAETYYLAGDSEASLRYWTKALQQSPDNVYLKTKKAVAHYRTSDWKGTIESAKKVFETDSVPMLLRMTGDANLNLLQSDSALFYYTKAIEKNPADHLAVHKLANVYYSAKLYDEAIEITDDYLQKINPNRKTIGQLNGMAHYSAGNYKKAIERLTRNTELGDSTYSTSYFLGMSYYASKLYFFSVPWLEKAYLINNNDINLLYYYGTALSRTYDRKKGIEILQEGMSKIETFMEMRYDFHLSFAGAYLASGNHAKAAEHYKSALGLQPDQTPLLYNIAHTYDIAKDYKNAIDYYERFLKTKPKDLDASKPIDPHGNEKMDTEEAYYRMTFKRVSELKEELFFKR